jgi:hypothetical protein
MAATSGKVTVQVSPVSDCWQIQKSFSQVYGPINAEKFCQLHGYGLFAESEVSRFRPIWFPLGVSL